MNDREGEPTGGPPAETSEGIDEDLVAKPAPRPESRARQLARVALRWFIILLIIFGAGAFVAYWFLYRPARAEISALNAQIGQANQQITDLQSEVDRLEPLGTENQRLQKELNEAQAHIQLLIALSEVNAARVSLAEENLPQAQTHLDNLSQNLETLMQTVPTAKQGEVIAMQNRLALVIDEMEQNAFAAQSDLEVLANSLNELESALFGET